MNKSMLSDKINECLRDLLREVRVAVTPIPRKNKWIFLVGCYNSGTTLLAKILGEHPDISALSTEGHFISDELIKDYEIGLPRMWVDREDLFTLDEYSEGPNPARLKKEWGMRLNTKKKYLLEKSPPNVPRMRWFNRHFNSPYFIGIVRNGYAVAEGISRKAKPMHLKSGWPIEKSAYQWSRSNEVMIENGQRVDNFLLIKYEDLTENTFETISRITEFLGIAPFSKENTDKQWSVHERNTKIRNMNVESFSRISENERKKIDDIAGKMLKHFNYSMD